VIVQAHAERSINISINDVRDADDEVHFSLVSDAGQVSTHLNTLTSSCWLIDLGRRYVEGSVCATVVIPTSLTRAYNNIRAYTSVLSYENN